MQGTWQRVGGSKEPMRFESVARLVRRENLPRRGLSLGFAFMLAALLAACASAPQRDGPEANPPPDLVRVPDAEPRLEPIRPGGPNKPYDVQGRNYVPITQDAPFTERGLASWYGRAFHGKRTASGEVYNMYAMTAAHPTLPIPSYARVRNPANGREIVVRINDRGPFHTGRIVDLSYTAALKLDMLRGVAPVELQRITFDDIRSGAWRGGANADATRTASADGAQPVRVAAASVASVAVPAAAVATVAATSEVPADPAATGRLTSANSADVPANPSTSANSISSNTPSSSTASASDGAASISNRTLTASAPSSADSSAPQAPVADAPAARAYTTPARGYWVQLGAFRVRDGAENFQKRVVAELDWLTPLLAVFNDTALYRLQAGPYPSREEARGVAERVRDGLKLVPVIVERR
jgi:rare lipoprotein A